MTALTTITTVVPYNGERVRRSILGFTTIELLIVTMAAAILLSVAVPQVRRSLSLSNLRSSANGVASELNFARSIAVTRNAVYEISFSAEAGTISIVDVGDPAHPPRVPKPLDTGISFGSIPSSSIRFYPRGHGTGGAVRLDNQFGETIVITVHDSGMVEVGDIESNG